jgi:ferric-dicitrate binding protein FerR (iron transport regulator)
VYVDAPVAEHVPLTIVTPYGAVEHLGTQYQAQVTQGAVTVTVREGAVSIAAEHMNLQVRAHEVAQVSERGDVSRHVMRFDGSADEAAWNQVWQWTQQAGPPFDIDNRSLAQFLEWVAHETGRTVQYATPEARHQAEALVLHGSIAGLEPDSALRAVLATTRFTHVSSASRIDVRL